MTDYEFQQDYIRARHRREAARFVRMAAVLVVIALAVLAAGGLRPW